MDMIKDFKKKLFVSTILTIPILILSPTIQNIFSYSLKFSGDKFIVFLLATLIFGYGGSPFLTGFYKEIKKQSPGMMTLIALAISVAYLYSTAVTFLIEGKTFFWELATLIDIMLLGHIIEMAATMKATFNIEQLIKLLPSKAHLILSDGSIKDIEIKALKENDKVLIKPGEKIPVDGKIINGQSEINEAFVTGESKPKFKKTGDSVIGGSINTTGSLEVLVQKTGNKTYLAQVIKLVKESLQNKSKTQNLADKFAKYLTFTAIFTGSLSLILWLIFNQTFAFALERMVTVMVITCPHYNDPINSDHCI
ncbi:MAG: HAD-IC family P-type ATPase [bacterium]